jgi:Alginate lyase
MTSRGTTRFIPGAKPGTDQYAIYIQQPDGSLAWVTVVLGNVIPDPPAPAAGKVPAAVLKLANWKLTIPTGPAKDATEVQQPALATYTDKYFRLNPAGDGVQLSAPCDGSTTSGSNYPRCELREMVGEKEAAWPSAKGVAHLTVDLSVDVLPPNKKQVVFTQIHGPDADLIELVGDGLNSALGDKRTALTVRYEGKTQAIHLDDDYPLGTRFTVDINVTGGVITIGYNGTPKLTLKAKGDGYYFKAGAYVQSNPPHGDTGDAYGQVTVYALTATHTT